MESILKVLVIGLTLGAGLPAVFALGLVTYSRGAGSDGADGAAVAPNPTPKYLGVALTIIHHTGIDLFPFLQK